MCVPDRNVAPAIAVVGSVNMDLVIRVDRLPIAGETIAGSDLALFPGGKGANQACAASRLGADVALVGEVGGDPFGVSARASLQQVGVDTRHLGTSARATGCASIYVLPSGDNSIVISPGANAGLDATTAVARLDAIGKPAYILLQLEAPLETVAAVLEWARTQGATCILDPAPARALPAEMLRQVGILTPNQSEAAMLLGRPPDSIQSTADAEAAAGALLALGPATVILKLGALGCLAADARQRVRVPAFAVTAVDTTAAGDTFNGALAVALSEGWPLLDAARFANAAAALSVTRRGAQPSVPSREEVDRFLETGRLAE